MGSARLTTMTNLVSANRKKAERGLEVLTGVIRNFKANGKRDRALIRAQNKALAKDMQTKISAYTQEGEARAKRIAHRARHQLLQVHPGQPQEDRRQLPVPQGLRRHRP